MGSKLSDDNDGLVAEINVTPLVDVVLVLLVIFMITAPTLFQSAIKVQLPKAETGGQSQAQTPLSFTVARDGKVYWGSDALDWPQLEDKLKKRQNGAEENVSVSADEMTPHGTVVKLMDLLRKYGLSRFALTVQSGK